MVKIANERKIGEKSQRKGRIIVLCQINFGIKSYERNAC
jgi:hypothetical protein